MISNLKLYSLIFLQISFRSKVVKVACIVKVACTHHDERVVEDPQVMLLRGLKAESIAKTTLITHPPTNPALNLVDLTHISNPYGFFPCAQ